MALETPHASLGFEDTVWGVDFNVSRIDVAILNCDSNPQPLLVSGNATRNKDAASDLWHYALAARQLFSNMADAYGEPTAISIESPAGRPNTTGPLLRRHGILMAAARNQFGALIIAPMPTEWKKSCIGKGNAKKPQEIIEWVLMLWPDLILPQSDHADAIALATDLRWRIA